MSQINISNSSHDSSLLVDDASKQNRSVFLVFALLIIFSTAATVPLFNFAGIPGFARNNGFMFVLLGLATMALADHRRIRLGKLVLSFLPLVLIGFVTSIGMSIYLTETIGSLFGETPISAMLNGLLWLSFDAVIVFFCSNSYARCSSDFLDNTFDLLLIFVLAVCCIQAGVSLGIPVFSNLFSIINVGGWFSIFYDVDFERLSGICSEPAAMSKTLGLLCLPYCYCRIRSGGGKRYKVAFILLLLFAFMTKSTTVYVTVACVFAGIIFINFHRVKSKAFYAVIVVCGFFVALIILLFMVNGWSIESSGVSDVFQSVLGKISDVGNASTAYRNSTIINDIEIFKDYPFFGVGDGNQGFFYAQNLPAWVLSSGSEEAIRALSGEIGVLNGGAFLPSLISGYGILGCVLFGTWIVSCIRMAITNKQRMGHFYEMFSVALFALIPICWMSEGFQGAPVAVFLVLCMPVLGADR